MMNVNSQLLFVRMRRLRWGWICLFLLVVPVYGQSDLNLEGAIDFQVHSSPDSAPRSIDADDLARLAKEKGMRGLVLKNHFESTAALAYMVRKEVPGMEIFGGIALNRAVGGINLEAVKRMTMMKGGWGRVVWLPTIDSENFSKQQKQTGPFVPVVKSGHLLAEVLGLIDYVAQHHEIVLETGHISAEEALMVVHEAHQRGVTHIVVTNPMGPIVNMTIPQMQQAAADGAYLELMYAAVVGPEPEHTISEYAETIRKVGPRFCILGTDLGGVGEGTPHSLHPQGLLDFMESLRKQGISTADINLMVKTNPALALGLK